MQQRNLGVVGSLAFGYYFTTNLLLSLFVNNSYKCSAAARMGDRARAKWADKWGWGAAVHLSVGTGWVPI